MHSNQNVSFHIIREGILHEMYARFNTLKVLRELNH